MEQLDQQLTAAKANKDELESKLSVPEIYSDKGKFLETETAYQQAIREIQKLSAGYESELEKLMELEENG